MQYLADIEEHLNITIDQIGAEMKVPMNEFDGKVMYGQKRSKSGKIKYLISDKIKYLTSCLN